MKILIAPWGYPKIYKEAEYYLDDKLYSSRTATGALKKAFNPDYTILILQDSLAVYNPETFKVQTYEELLDSLKKYLIEKYISNPEWLPEYNPERDIILIAPNVGTFKAQREEQAAKLVIRGMMSDYYYWIFYFLSQFLIDKITEHEEKEIELILDTTHGQNIMPYFTYNALYYIGAVIEFKFYNKVKIKVYNSDPFSVDAEYLRIHLVKEEIPKIQLGFKLHGGSFRPVSPNRNVLPQTSLSNIAITVSETFREYVRTYRHSVLPFLGAFSHGILLGLYTFFPEKLSEIIDKSYKLYNDNIKLSFMQGEKELVITKMLYFTEYFETTLKALNIQKILSTIGIKRKLEVSFYEMRETLSTLYINYPVIVNRLLDELDHLEKQEFIAHRASEWKPFREERNDRNLNKRNFFAHAGMIRNAIEYKYEAGTYWVRFWKKNLEQIENRLTEPLMIRL